MAVIFSLGIIIIAKYCFLKQKQQQKRRAFNEGVCESISEAFFLFIYLFYSDGLFSPIED